MIHPRFGDLTKSAVVSLPPPSGRRLFFREDRTLIIHLTVTGRCNARCPGCINSTITTNHQTARDTVITFEETQPERDTEIIQQISRRFPRRPVSVCFYGGEPFLALRKMVESWRRLRASLLTRRLRFMVYTNAGFVAQAVRQKPEFLRDIWLFSVSIDGDRAQHNRSRPGTELTTIRSNLRLLKKIRRGQVLMWSTLRENQTLAACHDEFRRLLNQGLVEHWYWHWPEIVEPFRDFESYARRYEQDLNRVLRWFTEGLQHGRLISVIHISELIIFLLTGRRRRHTGCAIERFRNYDIVNGRIFSCVDLPAELGDLQKNHDPARLISYKSALGCYQCGIHGYCGGRCPVQGLYGSRERTLQYCQLMRLHVAIVRDYLKPIRAALRKHRYKLQDLYDRSAYLTRFTDVTP